MSGEDVLFLVKADLWLHLSGLQCFLEYFCPVVPPGDWYKPWYCCIVLPTSGGKFLKWCQLCELGCLGLEELPVGGMASRL